MDSSGEREKEGGKENIKNNSIREHYFQA